MALDSDDLAMFVDEDMPGYVVASVGGVPLCGLFSSEYGDAFDAIAGTQPSLLIVAADAPAVVRGSAVVIGTASYSVAGIKPTGTGMTRLILEAV